VPSDASQKLFRLKGDSQMVKEITAQELNTESFIDEKVKEIQ